MAYHDTDADYVPVCCGRTCQRLATSLNLRVGSVVNYYDNLRGEYLENLKADPINFSGNLEYEVDECLIKAVIDKTSGLRHNQWIAGILERNSGLLSLYRIPDRSGESLTAPILEKVPEKSIIYSDDWQGYGELSKHNYIRQTVVHSRGEYRRNTVIKNKPVSVHINTLEGINHVIRQRLSNKSRRNAERIYLILAEITYRRSGGSLFWPFKVK